MSTQFLQTAKGHLASGNFTCVLCKDDRILTATDRGVKPLASWLHKGEDLRGYSAADKVVGKATAFLYCLLGISEVYAHVMSQSAMDVLQKNGIYAECGSLVPNIINRKGDGICPFEEAVLSITDPNEALEAIHQKMAQMHISL